MEASKFYPSIKELISSANLPSNLGFAQSQIAELFDRLFYRELKIFKSKSGDKRTYYLDLITYKNIGIELFGTGLALKLNPLPFGNGAVIPISLSFKLEILKYIGSLNSNNFPSTLQAFFETLLKILDITEEELIKEVINIFITDTNPINTWISNYNSLHQSSQIIVTPDLDDDIYIQNLISALKNIQVDIYELIFSHYLVDIDFNSSLRKIETLFEKWLGLFSIDNLKQFITPIVEATIDDINIALVFPSSILRQVDMNGIPIKDSNDDYIPGQITADLASIFYSTESGFELNIASYPNIDFTRSEILNSGLIIEIEDMKLDLSRTKNIPEAIADNRPEDFIGVYITKAIITLPKKWFSDSIETSPCATGQTGPAPEIIGTNLLIGTGGISGTIGFDSNGVISKKIGNFWICLDRFSITFQQNTIKESNITGKLIIPGFQNSDGNPLEIKIEVHIGTGGEFKLVASTTPSLTVFRLPDVFDFNVSKLFLNRQSDAEGGLWYVGITGDIDFAEQEQLGKFLPDKIDIKKMLIYEDGTFEFEGGKVYFPKAYEFSIGVAKIGITAISIGSLEKNGKKYKCFGFDGGVSTNPNSVSGKGTGINFYYNVADPLDFFIKIESISIDIIIPAGDKPEEAAVIIKGFLSMREPKLPEPTATNAALIEVLKNSSEYAGGVYVSIPKLRGLEASASMRLTPQVPAFLVDISVEFATGFPLGSTGLSLYGFRALFGKNYIASKQAVGLANTDSWYKYYKAQVAPDYHEGIQPSKFDIQEGFSFGAGVSMATSADAGKTIAAKVFIYLGLPVFTLAIQGQAAVLKRRIGLDETPDPPYSIFVVFTESSFEAAVMVKYKMPDDGARMGKVLTIEANLEMGFFFGDSSAWYVNIGTEQNPMTARVLDILDMESFIMISRSGIRAGASMKYNITKTFGPLSASLSAFIIARGQIGFRPTSFAGSLQLGGSVSLKCCGVGFSVSGSATLAGEAAKPKTVKGEFEVCVRILRKDRCAHFQFSWTDANKGIADDSQNPTLVDLPADQKDFNLSDPQSIADAKKVARATHMVTGDTYPLAVISNATFIAEYQHKPIVAMNEDLYIIPMDCFIDIEFKKGMDVTGNAKDKIGDLSTPVQNVEYIPPIWSGITAQVRHEYWFDEIEIKFFDEVDGNWKDYDLLKSYRRMLEQIPPEKEGVDPLTDPEVLKKMKWGYWQKQRPGHNTKLRILANNSLSYLAKTGNHITPEDMGITAEEIICPPPDPIQKTCVHFDKELTNKTYPAEEIHHYKNILFKLSNKEGTVIALPYNTIPRGLNIQAGDTLEITFLEAMHTVNILVKSTTPKVTISYYKRIYLEAIDINHFPTYDYELIKSVELIPAELESVIEFNASDTDVDYVTIETVPCVVNNTTATPTPYTAPVMQCLPNDESQQNVLAQLKTFFAKLIEKKHLAKPLVELNPEFQTTYAGIYMGTNLYPKQDWANELITLTQGYISDKQLLFTIADTHGFSCNFSFDVMPSAPPLEGFSFDKLVSITSLQANTENSEVGANYGFILECMFKPTPNAAPKKVVIKGKCCVATSHCFDACSSFLYEVCYLSADDYARNQSIPSKEERKEENKKMVDGINKSLNIIWAPDTAYAIYIKTTDIINGTSKHVELVYGFRTAGPVGFYHKYPKTEDAIETSARADYAALERVGHEAEFKLSTLKHYIDYDHSYPNAAGDLLNAKPLFYKNVTLQLFYLYNHVYEFYNDWKDGYEHTEPGEAKTIAKCDLQMEIKDPVDTLPIPQLNLMVGAPSSFVGSTESLYGLPNNIRIHNNDISILNNMLDYVHTHHEKDDCLPKDTKLKPIQISTKRTMDLLKPSKLYMAQYTASYSPRVDHTEIDGDIFAKKTFTEVVHSYGFQTSRYASFNEQINSYILKKNEQGEIIKAAIFKLNANALLVENVTLDIDLALAERVVLDKLDTVNTINDEPIRIQFADPFERLMLGVFHISPNDLQAPVTTEFNFIKHPDPSKNQILGILIRNQEPFNNPKLPATELEKTLIVHEIDADGVLGQPNEFIILHSKDKRNIFVTNAIGTVSSLNFNIPSYSKLQFNFSYRLYNGTEYEEKETVVLSIKLSDYSI